MNNYSFKKVKSRKLHEPDYVKAENRTITSIMLIKEVMIDRKTHWPRQIALFLVAP